MNNQNIDNELSEKNWKPQFYEIWMKGKHFQKLNIGEQILYDIMQEHPEYYVHYEAANTDDFDYSKTETNPFFHISLHSLIRVFFEKDIIQGAKEIADRLRENYNKLIECCGRHSAEHLIMNECIELILKENSIDSDDNLKQLDDSLQKILEEEEEEETKS